MTKNRKTLVCTVCSRKKDRGKGLLPAIERYLSPRITNVFQLARQEGHEFVILSGKYGFLSPEEPIPYYDRLLGEGAVGPFSLQLAAYLQEHSIGNIIFIIPSPEDDPKIIPYLKSIRRAARRAQANLQVRFIPPSRLRAGGQRSRGSSKLRRPGGKKPQGCGRHRG